MKAKSFCLCALFAAESLFAFAVPNASSVAQDFVTVIPSGQSIQVNNFAGTIGSQSIKAFSISKFEVTQDLYNSVMGVNPSSFKGNPAAGEVQGRRPVENITWYDAVFFCNQLTAQTLGAGVQCYSINDIKKDGDGKIVSATVTCDLTKTGYRLPTQAEWELAAGGGSQLASYMYSGGDDVNEVAWYYFNSDNKTREVGKKKPNELGIYDMSGNVWEWCNDLKTANGKCANRGGGYAGTDTMYYEITNRNWDPADFSNFYLGMRLARTLQ